MNNNMYIGQNIAIATMDEMVMAKITKIDAPLITAIDNRGIEDSADIDCCYPTNGGQINFHINNIFELERRAPHIKLAIATGLRVYVGNHRYYILFNEEHKLFGKWNNDCGIPISWSKIICERVLDNSF